MCVCTYHLNLKLMLLILDHGLDYKEVLNLCLCNITIQKCMLNHYDNSPKQFVIKDLITVQLLKSMREAVPLVSNNGSVQIIASL